MAKYIIAYYFIVECKVFQPPNPSVVINASHSIEAYIGDDLNISCIVASSFTLDSSFINWYKDGDEVPYAIPPAMHVDYIVGSFNADQCQVITTLSIRNLTYGDSGNYSCEASPTNKYPVTDTVMLLVKEHRRQPIDDYKLLIIEISTPVSVVIIRGEANMPA